MFIDVHVIQSVPPSNLNRDDTGAPKSSVYGGVRRARVSSQAWKKAVRRDFKDRLDKDDLGYRTKRVVSLVAGRMRELDDSLDEASAAASATAVLKAAGLTIKTQKPKKTKEGEEPAAELDGSDYLVFLSGHQITRLAELALREETPNKREAQAAFDQEHGIEVALFGRMVADDASLNVDASVQVAHAISTHAVIEESDYYTAVDDLNEDDESGAGMIGTIEFNSATIYRYATVNVGALRSNLADDATTVRAAQAFVRSFVLTMPSGKQNTFANRTLPAAVVVTVRPDQPVSLVGAFEEAVVGDRGEGLVEHSCKRLAAQADSVLTMVAAPSATYVVTTTPKAAAVETLGEVGTLDELIDRVGELAGSSSAGAARA